MIAERLAKSLPFHYGWVIVATAILVISSCLGLARLGLGMLLPSMGSDLALTYSQMGYISTGNFVGYLIAVAIAPTIMGRLGARKTIVFGLVLIAFTTGLMSQMNGFIAAVVVYVMTGLGSGLANIPVMALLAHWFLSRFRGRATGIAVTGSGFAMMLAGVAVPEINQAFGVMGWRIGWGAIGVLSVLIALISWITLRDAPKEMGLLSVGEIKVSNPNPGPIPNAPQPKLINGIMIHMGLIYFAFGATYITYSTFIVTTLVQEFGYSENVAGIFWFWIGFLSLFSGLIFGPLSDKLGRRMTIAIVYGLQTVAYSLAAIATNGWMLYLSIGLYGIAVFSIPAIGAAMIGDYLGPRRAAAGLSFITFFFAAGQVVGPASAGIAADILGSFTPAYGFCALITGLAIFVTLKLKTPSNHG